MVPRIAGTPPKAYFARVGSDPEAAKQALKGLKFLAKNNGVDKFVRKEVINNVAEELKTAKPNTPIWNTLKEALGVVGVKIASAGKGNVSLSGIEGLIKKVTHLK